MMTLREIILLRQNKFDEGMRKVGSEYWQGYQAGWFNAYRDLTEILKQNGFDLDTIVIRRISNGKNQTV